MRFRSFLLASALTALFVAPNFAHAAESATASKTAAAAPAAPAAMPAMPISPEKMKALQDSMEKAMGENKDLMEELGTKHQEIQKILSADKFDKVAFIEKNHEMAESRTKLDAVRTKAFANAIENFTKEERTALSNPPVGMAPHGRMTPPVAAPKAEATKP